MIIISGWDKLEQHVETKSSNEQKLEFTKFPEGNTILRILSPEPVSRWRHWIKTSTVNAAITCIGKGCPVCELIKQAKANKETPKYSSQRTHSFYVWNENTKKIELCEVGNNFFNSLIDFVQDLKDDGESTDLTKFNIRIRRSGTGQSDTRYSFKNIEGDVSIDQSKIDELGKVSDRWLNLEQHQILQVLQGVGLKEIFTGESEETEDSDDVVVL